MIFPSGTLAEGLAADLSPTSNMLVRLRLLHPITAIAAGVALIFIAGWLGREAGVGTRAKWWSNVVSLLVLGQLLFGSATLLMLAPIVMQLGHLFLVGCDLDQLCDDGGELSSRGQAADSCRDPVPPTASFLDERSRVKTAALRPHCLDVCSRARRIDIDRLGDDQQRPRKGPRYLHLVPTAGRPVAFWLDDKWHHRVSGLLCEENGPGLAT